MSGLQELQKKMYEIEWELKPLAHAYLLAVKNEQQRKNLKKKLERQGYEHHMLDILIARAREDKEEVAKEIRSLVVKHIVWQEWLSKIKGVEAVTAGLLLGLVPARKYENVSKLWAHVGLAPPKYYEETGKVPNMRCKFVVLLIAHNITRVGRRTRGSWYYMKFREFYEYEKQKSPDLSEDHLFLRARRRLAKLFTGHYFEVYRKLLGLPCPQPYFAVKGLHTYIPPHIDKGVPEPVPYTPVPKVRA